MQVREVFTQIVDSNVREDARCATRGAGDDGWAGLTSQRMTVTGLGRAIGGAAREKHNIKRADRLIGSVAKERGLMRHYQANTVRHREVLSVIFLGIRIIERAQDHFTATELCIAWQSIPLRNARVPTLES